MTVLKVALASLALWARDRYVPAEDAPTAGGQPEVPGGLGGLVHRGEDEVDAPRCPARLRQQPLEGGDVRVAQRVPGEGVVVHADQARGRVQCAHHGGAPGRCQIGQVERQRGRASSVGRRNWPAQHLSLDQPHHSLRHIHRVMCVSIGSGTNCVQRR